MSSPSLKLNVWRPCRWEREYLNLENRGIALPDSFQECLYVWEACENPRDALTKPRDSDRFQEVMELFLPEKTPLERSIAKLSCVCELLDDLLSLDEDIWMESAMNITVFHENTITLRQNRLLAFRHQIQWVYDTFLTVPQANVTLR
jgi:hypothetical protein